MTGFVLGICSANLWMKQYVLDIGILNQYFLEQYNQTDIVYEAYLWYLVKSRGTPFVLLLAAAGTRYRKTCSYAGSGMAWILFWYGDLYGHCTDLGSKGIVLMRYRCSRHRASSMQWPGYVLFRLYAGISSGEMGCPEELSDLT